jgi:hypothetical protein
MVSEIWKDDCDGCKFSIRKIKPEKIRIELDGDWILNHYDGKEGFLGWMALQPRYHRMGLTELGASEAKALVRNVQKVEIGLRHYWSIIFSDDPIEKVYLAYFLEGDSDRPEPSKWHLHIHLIPRTKEMGGLLRTYSEDGNINAWMIHCLKNDKENGNIFWLRYRERNDEDVNNLMIYLRCFLGSFLPDH